METGRTQKQFQTEILTKHSEEMTKEVNDNNYIVSIDLGTTTIAMELVGARSARRFKTWTIMNPQASYGADVISRIRASSEVSRDGRPIGEILRDLVREAVSDGLTALLQNVTEPVSVYLAGNTVMTHLFLGRDVTSLGEVPFRPVTLDEGCVRLSFDDGQREIDVHTLPMLSAFVGGDITAGLCAVNLKEGDLFLDLGTNGEMVLLKDGRYRATATAAGPAFASPSDSRTGTDKIALISRMLRLKLMDRSGYIEDEETAVRSGFLSMDEVREIQLAKGATRAGLECLLRICDMDSADIGTFHIAGGFGFHLDARAAEEIGMIPEGLAGKVKIEGNTSLYGAYLWGRSRENGDALSIPPMAELRRHLTGINLAAVSDFKEKYISYMDF